MCGIAGIIGHLSEPNRGALSRMSAAMKHRGPDAEGTWFSSPDSDNSGCLLAHRRLSILDLSPCAAQPMVDPATGKTIVFNGEIYNFKELRDELCAQGQTFQSSGDTAVMLRALATQGYRAVEKLRGMFAFALWDDVLRQITLARDPLGIKPLYVCRNPDPDDPRWKFIFASEVRAILASGLIAKPRLNPAAVESIVWNGFVAGPITAVEGIETLMPGEVQIVDSAGAEQHREYFWNMPQPAETRSRIDEDEIAHAIGESVKLHMVSDVPLGVFLSGGIDSSAVANLAQKASNRPIQTFTLAFQEHQWNEGEFARQIAAAIGSDHHEILLTGDQFLSQLEPALESLDQPTFDGLNSYYISRAVREAGLTVALIGTGGDELFGGYSTFRHLPRLHRLSNNTSWMPDSMKVGAARAVAAVAQRSRGAAVAPQTRWAKLPCMMHDGDDLVALYQLSYALFLPTFQDELLRDSNNSLVRGLPQSLHDRLERETHNHTPLSALSILELRCFLGERLLRDTDAASMSVSLEVRLPLVDSVVVEQLNRIKESRRYHPVGRKQLLRDIGLRGLDPQLFERPKSGFVLPFEHWIRSSLRKTMDQTMRDPEAAARVGLSGTAVARLWQAYQDGAKGMYWSRVWALYILMRWCQRHDVFV